MRIAVFLILLAGCAGSPVVAENVRDGRGYCPICVEWHEAAAMKWPVEHAGKTYAFCDPNCRAGFLRDPEKFLKDPVFNPVK